MLDETSLRGLAVIYTLRILLCSLCYRILLHCCKSFLRFDNLKRQNRKTLLKFVSALFGNTFDYQQVNFLSVRPWLTSYRKALMVWKKASVLAESCSTSFVECAVYGLTIFTQYKYKWVGVAFFKATQKTLVETFLQPRLKWGCMCWIISRRWL